MLIIKINNKTMIKNAPNCIEIVIKIIKNYYRAIAVRRDKGQGTRD
jgi:hypothetical protein